MASCKDCMHEKVCDCFGGDLNEEGAENCVYFKDRNRFADLPCKVGDTVYQTDGIRIYENKIERIIFDTNNIGFDETSIGKSIFLTREEAEQVIKERENNANANKTNHI